MTLTLTKTPARIQREKRDAEVAAGYAAYRRKFPKESDTTIFLSMANSAQFAYGSPSGIRASLLRSGTITLR